MKKPQPRWIDRGFPTKGVIAGTITRKPYSITANTKASNGPCAVSSSILFGLGLPRAQSPSHGILQLAKRLPILHRQLYNKCTLIPPPYIACWAARKPITAMIDLYERRTAAVAATGHESPVIEVRTDPAVDESSPRSSPKTS
jgi:hypothetical protein